MSCSMATASTLRPTWPPNGLLAILGRGKWDIVAALRLRQVEESRRVTQWVADNFTASPAGVCAHCGDGQRSDDRFVLLFVGNDRGDVHASCYSGASGVEKKGYDGTRLRGASMNEFAPLDAILRG